MGASLSADDLGIAPTSVPHDAPPPTASNAPADLDNGVLIPAGTFEMGDADGLAWGATPVHNVPVHAFVIGQHEVSQHEYGLVLEWARIHGLVAVTNATVLNTVGEPHPLLHLDSPVCGIAYRDGHFAVAPERAAFPCVAVTWHGALAYGVFRTLMENERGTPLTPAVDVTNWTCDFAADGYRLPTEAEWEKAARGGLRGMHFPWPGAGGSWSNHLDGSQANYRDSGDPDEPLFTPCGYYNGGQFPKGAPMTNGYGLYDMAGNVWEWCWDWFDAEYYRAQPAAAWPANPAGPARSPWDARAIRGGSFFYTGEHLRCAYRSYNAPQAANHLTGFRWARSLPGATPPSVTETSNLKSFPSGSSSKISNLKSVPSPSARLTRAQMIEADWLRRDGLLDPDADFKAAATNALALARATAAAIEERRNAAARTPTAHAPSPHPDHPQTDTGLGSGRLQPDTEPITPPHTGTDFARLRATLTALDTDIRRAAPDTDWKALYLNIRWCRRRIALSDPLLAFDRLLIVQRGPPDYLSNLCDQYYGRYSRPGPGLVVLEDWRGEAPRARPLLTDALPPGAVLNPDVAFDGHRILFAFCDHSPKNPADRRFFIYEAESDGSSVRQLTGVPGRDPLQGEDGRTTAAIEDFDPCYLPDGSFVFLSTRCQSFGRCHGGRDAPAFVLYRADADGGHIRRLSFGEMNEWNPAVLPDGRLLFTRWEHVNRHDALFQGLWTCRPDGSGVAHYYGNYTANPSMTAEAKPIPASDKVVCTAMAHHSYAAGSLVTIDPSRGEDGEAPLRRITPETCFPETEGWPAEHYASPWPLSEEVFLAAGSLDRLPTTWENARLNAYGIYLVDTLGGRELLYRDPEISCFSPIPLRPRLTPPVIPSVLSPTEPDGRLIVQNVYRSTQTLVPGSVKAIRIVRLHPQPTARVAPRGLVEYEVVKSVVGTVPVQPDGSAAFRVPAEAPLLFQLLDAHGMALFGMRSFTYLQRGELQGCIGCHEPRHTTTPSDSRFPAAVSFAVPEPPAGPRYDGGFSFARTVQPVLDRYCIRCHGLERMDGNLNLLGTLTAEFNQAYETLLTQAGLVALAQRNRETWTSRPGDYGARAGRLGPLLASGHNGHATLDDASLHRICDWLDLNAPYYGDYAYEHPERRRPAEEPVRVLRAHLRETCGACHAGMERQPLAALVNVALPEESRVLLAPLAATAGGWAQHIGTNAWSNTNAPGYQTMRRMIAAALDATASAPDL